jgi:hypothetical protein
LGLQTNWTNGHTSECPLRPQCESLLTAHGRNDVHSPPPTGRRDQGRALSRVEKVNATPNEVCVEGGQPKNRNPACSRTRGYSVSPRRDPYFLGRHGHLDRCPEVSTCHVPLLRCGQPKFCVDTTTRNLPTEYREARVCLSCAGFAVPCSIQRASLSLATRSWHFLPFRSRKKDKAVSPVPVPLLNACNA